MTSHSDTREKLANFFGTPSNKGRQKIIKRAAKRLWKRKARLAANRQRQKERKDGR